MLVIVAVEYALGSEVFVKVEGKQSSEMLGRGRGWQCDLEMFAMS